jgi:hypothetical protein
MKPTIKTHYNPCLWTAHWNPEYFELARTGKRGRDARHQRVFVLHVIANDIFHRTVENVHFENQLGLAEVTLDEIKEYVRKYTPDRYEACCKDLDQYPPVTAKFDFENILTELEGKDAYKRLLEVIQKGTITSASQRIEIGVFLLFQALRSHRFLHTIFELGELKGIPKFEELLVLSRCLGSLDFMVTSAMGLTMGRWRLYRVDQDMFPLTDVSIMIEQDSVMAALSPRLLLEIDRLDHSAETGCSNTNFIRPEKLDEFRRRTIGNTHREIIFGDRALLEQWQRTPEFARQHELIANGRKKADKSSS